MLFDPILCRISGCYYSLSINILSLRDILAGLDFPLLEVLFFQPVADRHYAPPNRGSVIFSIKISVPF